jgi:hypothetical protein
MECQMCSRMPDFGEKISSLQEVISKVSSMGDIVHNINSFWGLTLDT